MNVTTTRQATDQPTAASIEDKTSSNETTEASSSRPIEDLLTEHLPMVEAIARSFVSHLPSSIELDDLVIVGALGLVQAWEHFDPDRGVSFEHFASMRVRGAIQDELRKLDWMPRTIRSVTRQLDRITQVIEHQVCRRASDSEIAEALGIDLPCYQKLLTENPSHSTIHLDEFDSRGIRPIEMELQQNPGIEHNAQSADLDSIALSEELALVMDSLNDRQRMVMELYYFGELTMKEIGEELGLTEGRVSQIHSESIAILRARLRDLETEAPVI